MQTRRPRDTVKNDIPAMTAQVKDVVTIVAGRNRIIPVGDPTRDIKLVVLQ